ncbi:MAG TPA: hypothetical protein VGP62_03535 [Bryobacteraceae bacterium]|nr:hypothetical protein [Bryobacteraceae bacterium]
MKNGEAEVLTKEKLRERFAKDSRGRFGFGPLKQAEQKGLPYQTYIKWLLHETLTEREKRKLG